MILSSALSALTAVSALSAASALSAQSPSADPHPPYWQQAVRYDIIAQLDEEHGRLAGRERITYINHSPDTLRTFSLHLHLNAFRPGSRWSDADSLERRRRFNDLKDPDYAYNHVDDVRIMGEQVKAIYPLAPDSTIVRFALPAALAPGDSMVVEMQWDARPSTTPRRQGRRGRAYDFAQWYPKVVVYDTYGWNENPLVPAGEFYGEFGTYLVQLDVPIDEVVGATGVPLCGDPGWERANQVADLPIRYQRDFYPRSARIFMPASKCGPRLDGGADLSVGADKADGADTAHDARKKIVWYAEDVHHFAMSMRPDYRYEGGAFGDVAVHVLYQPGDTASWGRGIATRRTAIALEWLNQVFGKFAWPQITNVHRIEGGGTEFPMMIHDGSASQGLIVHELGHNYVMGILANNEWREGWMDEGFTSYQTTLFAGATAQDTAGRVQLATRGDEEFITGLDLDGLSEPTSLLSQDYRDFNSYQIGIYTRGELFFHQLQYVVGGPAMRQILHTYYDRWKLKHVNEDAFREVAEEVSGMDLKGFFAQQLHAVELVDYAVGRVTARRLGGSAARPLENSAGSASDPTNRPTVQPSNSVTEESSTYRTRVEVIRKAPGRLPVEVWVIAQGDTAMVRAEGNKEREWVEVDTRTKPKEILLDPRVDTHDWNLLNNRRLLGFHLFGSRPKENYIDTWFSTRVRRDKVTTGWLPTIWYNDAGGITLGLRHRSDYFGRFEQDQVLLSQSTGWANDEADVKDADFFLRIRNPIWLRSAGLTQSYSFFNVEGRFGAMLDVEKTHHDHLGWGPVRKAGIALRWVQPDDTRYLDPGYYDDVGTAELELRGSVSDRRGPWQLSVATTGGSGLVYNHDGLTAATGRTDLHPFYGRATLEATATRRLGTKWKTAFRLFGGVSTGEDATAKQRQIYAAGADPLQQLTNPFLRSRGALLLRPDIYYHAPGGGDLRGFDPRLSLSGLVSLNVELERDVITRPNAKLFRRVALAAFGDAGHAIDTESIDWLADAGVGLRAQHRIGDTEFTTRFDLPLFVSRPELAQDGHPGSEKVGFRWSFSFSPTF